MINPDLMLVKAMKEGTSNFTSGRKIVSFDSDISIKKEIKILEEVGLKNISVSSDYSYQNDMDKENFDAVILEEINVAILNSQEDTQEGAYGYEKLTNLDLNIEEEFFVYAESHKDFLKGFQLATNTIAEEILGSEDINSENSVQNIFYEDDNEHTWGLIATKVYASNLSGKDIKIAILDTGLDLEHPDFKNRNIIYESFVGQDVNDLNGHGTHCCGTACGPKKSQIFNRRYGIAYESDIYIGKVLTNSGVGLTGSVLAGFNWAIANNCHIISASLGSQSPVSPAYTEAGNRALRKNLLIIAAAGNSAGKTGAPANSPSIVSVASLDRNLEPSYFSNYGKIEIAAPGRDVYSSWPRPGSTKIISGTSMATPHVAGCAALLASSDPSLRGIKLLEALLSKCLQTGLNRDEVGEGLVQAPY